MRLTGSRAYVRPTPVPKMPTGLVELMEDLTRDVLKNNPPDVYEFCAGHMRSLLEIRDGPSSFKAPLTLEEKIARAQEQVRKRSEARWRKHLNEKKKYYTQSHIPSDSSNMTTIQEAEAKSISPVLKPPILSNGDIDKASEIEIFHEPVNVIDFPENVDEKFSHIRLDDKTKIENKELDKENDTSINDTFTSDNKTNDNISTNANVSDTGSNDNYVSINKNVANITEIESKNLHNLSSIEDSIIITLKEDLIDSPSNAHEKDEGVDLNVSKEVSSPPVPRLAAKSEQTTKNSITDMGNIVNTAIGVLGVINESSHSPSQYTETVEVNNDSRNSDSQHTNNLQTDVEKTNLTTGISDITDEFDTKINAGNEMEHSVVDKQPDYSMNDDNMINDKQDHLFESTLKEADIKINKNVDGNNRHQENIPVSSIRDGTQNENKLNIESDEVEKIVKEKTEKSNLEPPITNVNVDVNNHHKDVKIDFMVVGAENVPVLSNQFVNIEYDGASSSSGGIQVNPEEFAVPGGSSEESLINVVNDTSNPLEGSNEENIIEIRISQVAEALNNEMPLTDDNVEIEEDLVPLIISSLDKENNESNTYVMYAVEENGNVNSEEDVDGASDTIFVDVDDNTNITKSTSADESIGGMDNTNLIESGTSETTDDMHLNNKNSNHMDLETAAVTIQKVFRSFMFKSRASTFDDNENISLEEDNEKKDEEFQSTNINKERRGLSRMDTVLQTVNEEKSLSLSTDDSSTLSSAATIIQAHVRGFLVRNKLHSNKTVSTNSLVNSEAHDDDDDINHKNNKTVLNIIVPEGGNYLSRDESMLTSIDLSLDGSPPSSLNLHPLGYDKNERRKLKREDAIQSISPPSNNSGKLSEDVDSVKDMLITDSDPLTNQIVEKEEVTKDYNMHNSPGSGDTSPTNSLTNETVIEAHKLVDQESSDADTEANLKYTKRTLTKQSSDEMDVVTPFKDKNSLADSDSTSKLMHSGEFHDIVLPTKVSRSDATVVSEFKNVLVYFLLWNTS